MMDKNQGTLNRARTSRLVNRLLTSGAVAAASFAGSQATHADLTSQLFPNTQNMTGGDARRGTVEDFINTNAINPEYLSPDNIVNGAPVVVGSQPGHIASQRLGLGGSVGINTAQLHDVGGSTDGRASYENRLDPTFATAFGARPIWSARIGAAVQLQSIANGSTDAISPPGSAAMVIRGLTPSFLSGAVAGQAGDGSVSIIPPFDNATSVAAGIPGTAPGSATADGIADVVPWKLEIGSSDRLVTGFDLSAFDPDIVTAVAGFAEITTPGGGLIQAGPDLDAAIDAFSGRVEVYENGQPYTADAGRHDEDNFNHNGSGTLGFAGDQLANAVDGSLVLSGYLFNVNIQQRWEAALMATDPGPDGIMGAGFGDPDSFDNIFIADPATVRRSIQITGDVHYDSGQYFDDNLLGNIGPSGLPEGFFSLSWTDIVFSNTTGIDVGDGIDDASDNPYDYFTGDLNETFAGGLRFTIVPEPSVATMLALSAWGMLGRRRSAKAS